MVSVLPHLDFLPRMQSLYKLNKCHGYTLTIFVTFIGQGMGCYSVGAQMSAVTNFPAVPFKLGFITTPV